MQMQVQQSWLSKEERMSSPENYTYYQEEFLGKKVPTAKLNKIWRKYLQQQLEQALYQACKATGSVAIRSTVLSKREKTTHAGKQYITGNNSYYLFPEDAIPLNIYVRLKPQEGKLIYEKDDLYL